MINLTLSNEQAQIILDAINLRIDDLSDYLPPDASVGLDYRGDEELKIVIAKLKSLATLLDHQIN